MGTQIVTCFCLLCNDALRKPRATWRLVEESEDEPPSQRAMLFLAGEMPAWGTSTSWHHGVSATRPACYYETHSGRRLSPFPLFPVIFQTLTEAWGFLLLILSSVSHPRHLPPRWVCWSPLQKAQLFLSLLLELSILGSQSWRRFTDCLPFMSPKF